MHKTSCIKVKFLYQLCDHYLFLNDHPHLRHCKNAFSREAIAAVAGSAAIHDFTAKTL